MQKYIDKTNIHWQRSPHPADPNVHRWRFVDNGVPLVTVDETPSEHHLAFVEAKNGYHLKDLMQIFDSWVFETDASKPQTLEDDALFADGDNCSFRALTHRALNGKPSIYAKYGYVPDLSKASKCRDDLYTLKEYTNDLKRLGVTKATIWPLIVEYVLPRKAVELNIPQHDVSLGKVLEEAPCEDRRMAYNDIIVATNKWRKEHDAPDGLRAFLIAMCSVELVNRHLIKSLG